MINEPSSRDVISSPDSPLIPPALLTQRHEPSLSILAMKTSMKPSIDESVCFPKVASLPI